MKKTGGIILAALVTAAALSGCGQKAAIKQTADETFSYEEGTEALDYGANIRRYSDLDITISADERYVDEDMAKVVSDYYYAIQTQNMELYKSATIDIYQDYLMNVVYADEKYDEKSFLKALNTGMKNAVGGNFKINEIEVSDVSRSETTLLSSIYDMLDELSGEDYSNEKIEDGAELTTAFIVESDKGENEITDQKEYLIKFDGKWHLITG
jgi:hypothetical protein